MYAAFGLVLGDAPFLLQGLVLPVVVALELISALHTRQNVIPIPVGWVVVPRTAPASEGSSPRSWHVGC